MPHRGARIVEVHRARIMEKIGARNAADLVRIVLTGAQLPCRHAVVRIGGVKSAFDVKGPARH